MAISETFRCSKTLFISLFATSLMLAGGCASSLEKARHASQKGEYQQAEELYQRSIREDKTDEAQAKRELADLKIDVAKGQSKDQPEKAEQLYRQALTLNPKAEDAQLGLGRLLAHQNRMDEAIAVLSETYGEQSCDRCQRYLAVLLSERGKHHKEQNQLDEAMKDYQRAMELAPDTGIAFSLAQIYIDQGKDEEAAAIVEKALPLIRDDDSQAQSNFIALREQVVLKAAADGNWSLADRFLLMFPPGSGGDRWYILQLQTAQEQWRRKDADGALNRIKPLLGPEHKKGLSDARRLQLEKFVVTMYKARGSQRLRAGQVDAADGDFALGLQIDASDETLQLLRSLSVAARGQLDTALKVVQTLPEQVRGRGEVIAILESMRVHQYLAKGDVEQAQKAVQRAQAASPNQPEVHIALAAVLMHLPIKNLPKKSLKMVQRQGKIRYPGGSVRRYGEALSELSWAEAQAAAQGDFYLFRGPGMEQKLLQLRQEIRKFYPFSVEFNQEATSILNFKSKGKTLSVEVQGPQGFSEAVEVSPAQAASVTVPVSGMVQVKTPSQTLVFVAEPYTKVTIEL